MALAQLQLPLIIGDSTMTGGVEYMHHLHPAKTRQTASQPWKVYIILDGDNAINE